MSCSDLHRRSASSVLASVLFSSEITCGSSVPSSCDSLRHRSLFELEKSKLKLRTRLSESLPLFLNHLPLAMHLADIYSLCRFARIVSEFCPAFPLVNEKPGARVGEDIQ